MIRDFLHRGALAYLAAEGGSGKSTLIYRAAEAISTGSLFMDQLATTQGRVLVIQGDEPEADANAKFRLMGLAQCDAFRIAFVEPPLDLNWLTAQISSGTYAAVFLDSATTLLATADREVTDSSFARQLYRLGRAFADHQVSGLVSAHLNKPADGQIRRTVTKHDIAGVAAISAAVTDIWAAWRDPKPSWEDHFNVACLGKRYCKEGTLWQLQGSEEDFSWSIRETANGGLLPQQKLNLQQRILQHLIANPGPQSVKEVSMALSASYEHTRRCCVELFSDRLIRRQLAATHHQGRPLWLYAVEVNHD